ncbi:hypothetical protein EB118_09800 [bacterium]|nr:hypothetical protein [bacterium]
MEGADNLIRILITLKNRADSTGSTAQFSWEAISNMLQNVSGLKMDYETFKKQYDEIPELQQIIDGFDKNGVRLTTRQEPEATKSGNKPSDLNVAAKRAANKVLQQPG